MSGLAVEDRLVDGFGRRFRYLRLSITEVCNFRCDYCLPDGYHKRPGPSFLDPDEIAVAAAAFARLGVAKVRLTGGEPSVRKDLTAIIARVAGTAGVTKVAMTTNGWNLDRRFDEWRSAGLTHLNVSIDSLDRERFAAITGHDRLGQVLRGVDRALEDSSAKVKVNGVLLRSAVGQGFDAFADYVRDRPVAVRFIELMRTGENAAYFDREHVPGEVLRRWLGERGWTPRPRAADDGPATEYGHPDYRGRIGLIAPYAPGFCDSCNRLRLTSTGQLRLCLFGELGVGLRDLLTGRDDARLDERILKALGEKPAGHRLAQALSGDTRNLAQFGG